MIYSQIEDSSLGTGDTQDVMDNLQPHVALAERKVQELCEASSISINWSPERLFCKPRQKLHVRTSRHNAESPG